MKKAQKKRWFKKGSLTSRVKKKKKQDDELIFFSSFTFWRQKKKNMKKRVRKKHFREVKTMKKLQGVFLIKSIHKTKKKPYLWRSEFIIFHFFLF